MKEEEREILARTLHRIGLADFNSSQLLFENNIYPNSLYFLQQSIEKLSKATAIKFHLINSNQLKSIGHQGYKIFIDPSKNHIKEVSRFNSNYTTIDKFQEALNESVDQTADFLKLLQTVTESDLEEIGNPETIDLILSKIEGDNPTEKVNFNTLTEEHTENFIEFMVSSKATNLHIREKEEQINYNDYKEDIKKVSHLYLFTVALLQGLLWLNFLLTPHQNSTRYPIKPEFKSPIDKYNTKNPIIQKFNPISEAVYKSYIMYEIVINFLEHNGSKSSR